VLKKPMRGGKMRRFALGGAILAVGLILGSTPAQATDSAGSAGLGWAEFTKNGETITIPSLSPCTVDGMGSASSGVVSGRWIKFGGGTTSCTRTVVDPYNDVTTTKSEAVGRSFELSALVSVGGPRIRLAGHKINCSATQSGTSATWSYSGLSGFSNLPQPLPTNYLYPVRNSQGAVLALVTFAETQPSNPADGSIAVAMMNIRFQPASGIYGEVIVGTAACSPTP
jgi:hypothetical protein